MAFTTVQRFDTWELRRQVAQLLTLPEGDVRQAWGAGPTGDRPFVVLNMSNSLPQGPARSDFDGANELERITSSTLDTWTFEAYGTDAYPFARKAAAILQSEQGQALFRRLRAGLVSIGEALDLSGLAGAPEERARFQITVSVNESYQVGLESIRRANIDVHYEPHGVEHIQIEPPDDE
jgi:hypothetical protein